MLLAVSRVNEGVPLFLVEGIKRRLGPLASRRIAVLGLTFKRDTDDERDSLSPKLIRLLERELADVDDLRPARPDPDPAAGRGGARRRRRDRRHQPLRVRDRRGARRRSSETSPAHPDCLIVDPWNSLGTAQVFMYAAESAALLAQPADQRGRS